MTTQQVISRLHQEAVEAMDQSKFYDMLGDKNMALHYCDLAFRLDSIVADYFAEGHQEPTRSRIHRNVAFMALYLGNFNKATDLAERGLNGNPPEDVRKVLELARKKGLAGSIIV